MKEDKRVEKKAPVPQRKSLLSMLLKSLAKLFNVELVSFSEFIRRWGAKLKGGVKKLKQINVKKILYKLFNPTMLTQETTNNNPTLTSNIEPAPSKPQNKDVPFPEVAPTRSTFSHYNVIDVSKVDAANKHLQDVGITDYRYDFQGKLCPGVDEKSFVPIRDMNNKKQKSAMLKVAEGTIIQKTAQTISKAVTNTLTPN